MCLEDGLTIQEKGDIQPTSGAKQPCKQMDEAPGEGRELHWLEISHLKGLDEGLSDCDDDNSRGSEKKTGKR